MGDNAKYTRDWHNVEVGQGYQARGVVRQPTAAPAAGMKIVDYSKPDHVVVNNNTESSHNHKKPSTEIKSHSDKKDKKKDKKKKVSKSKSSSKSSFKFNPLLQLLATRLSDKTMSFST